MQILAYNRVVKDLNGHKTQEIMKKLRGLFEVEAGGEPEPVEKHRFGFYINKQWHSLYAAPELIEKEGAIGQLDVTILQRHVLGPIFGIEDQRTSQRVNFVGGIRGISELERLVDSGEYACAFSMYPTSIEDLMSIADADEIMPPKSTWFEPKLRDAMFCHMI